MSNQDNIQTICENIQALLLFQDESKPINIESLRNEYRIVFESDLNSLVAANGFTDVVDLLKNSSIFKVFEKNRTTMVKLAETHEKNQGKVTLEWVDTEENGKEKNKSKSKSRSDETNVELPQLMETEVDQNVNDVMDTSECIEVVESNNNMTDAAKIDKSKEPTFVVKISDDVVLKEHERKRDELKQKDLRHLINAKRFIEKREWKNDMFQKLYPEEMDKQAKLVAEKQRRASIRKHFLDA